MEGIYGYKESHQYDEKFTTPHGQIFDSLEWEEMARTITSLPLGASVLEVGCGTARFSKRLAELGYHVSAVDPSEHMIKLAMDKCRDLDNIKLVLGEGTDLHFQDCAFDLCFAIRVLNNTGSVDYALKTIREMIRVTKPHGLILIEFINRQRPFRRKSSHVMMSYSQVSEFSRMLGCSVLHRRGIMVLSQPLLEITPVFLLPTWCILEKLFELFMWRWASRGYVLLKKQP